MENCKELPAILYHYCTVKEFIDIVSNKQIMLKDLQKYDKFANLNKIVDMINYILQYKNKNVIKNKDIFKTLPIFGLGNLMKKYGNNILPFFYAFILSSNCDKWYMYQKNSADLCIGLRMDSFKLFKDNKLICLKKVNYDIKELENIIDGEIENYIQEYKPNSDDDNSLENIWKYINSDLISESIAYKNEYFSEENEYRLILDSQIKKLFLEDDNSYKNLKNAISSSIGTDNASLSELKFMTENNQLVSYKYFRYSGLLNLIESVYINPVCNITESDIKQVLSTQNIKYDDIKIEKTSLE